MHKCQIFVKIKLIYYFERSFFMSEKIEKQKKYMKFSEIITFGIGLFGGFSRGEGAARDDHSQRQEQRQKLAHRNTPPVSYCAFAQKVL